MFDTLRHCVMAVSLGHTNVSLYILPLVWMMCSLLHLFALCTYTLSTGKTAGCSQPRNSPKSPTQTLHSLPIPEVGYFALRRQRKMLVTAHQCLRLQFWLETLSDFRQHR